MTWKNKGKFNPKIINIAKKDFFSLNYENRKELENEFKNATRELDDVL